MKHSLRRQIRRSVNLVTSKERDSYAGGMFPDQAKVPMPPAEFRDKVGGVEVFHDVPLVFLARLNMAGLEPTHRILEIGCGVGRVARYLCDYLDDDGSFEGFDILPELIAWCQQHITPMYPNFHFTATPLRNDAYVRDSNLPSASTFRFPYDDNDFDFVAGNSVFTHLLPDAAANYLHESARVLKPGGVACTTWFLLDDDGYTNPFAAPLRPVGEMGWVREKPGDAHAFLDPQNPEAAVAYDAGFVRKMFEDAHLEVQEPLVRGYRRIQDLVIAKKPG
jgi:SAM-dependent methyltransferase